METETRHHKLMYGITQKESDGPLLFSMFGPNTYDKNVNGMEVEGYLPAKTCESISLVSIALCNKGVPFFRKVVDALYSNRILLGLALHGRRGVFINPPKDYRGRVITSERELAKHTLIHNGVSYGDNGQAFATYGSFEPYNQCSEDFAASGLALALEDHLEHGNASAPKIMSIVSRFGGGVYVRDFESNPHRHKKLKVAAFYLRDNALFIDGVDPSGGDWTRGYAFGVQKSSVRGAHNAKN